MTAAEALRDARGYASANRYDISGHARKRMRQRGVTAGDLHHALTNAASCDDKTDHDGGWRMFGPDLDGEEIIAVVVFEDGMMVVTLHGD